MSRPSLAAFALVVVAASLVVTPLPSALAQPASNVAPAASLAAVPLTVTVVGVTSASLRRDGYAMASGHATAVQHPDARHTVVVVTPRRRGDPARRVRIEHPAGLALPFVVGMDFECEVGERRGGFGGTYRAYAAVRSEGRTLVSVNADEMYPTDLHVVRGPVSETPASDAAMRSHEATVRAGATVSRVAPATWSRVTTPDGAWLVWQRIESIRPNAPPPPPGVSRDARNEVIWVWQGSRAS